MQAVKSRNAAPKMALNCWYEGKTTPKVAGRPVGSKVFYRAYKVNGDVVFSITDGYRSNFGFYWGGMSVEELKGYVRPSEPRRAAPNQAAIESAVEYILSC